MPKNGTDSDSTETVHSDPIDAASAIADGIANGALLSKLNGYSEIRPIGHGGQATVHEATETISGRPVAFKLLRRARALDSDALAHFQSEVKALASTLHPNIIRLYSAFFIEGTPCFMMPKLEGVPITSYVPPRRHTQKPQTETTKRLQKDRDILSVFRDVASGLAAIHDHGAVHRDLKPSNILVEGDTPFILDFGLARLLASGPPNKRVDHRVGTPGYMAPEQITIALGPISYYTDVYAFGVLLYETLSNKQRPYRVAELTPGALLDAIPQHEVVPLIERRHDIDLRLHSIVMKCLAFNPAERYKDAGALLHDIDLYLAGSIPSAHKCRWTARVRCYCSQHKTRIAALGAIAAICLAFGFERGHREYQFGSVDRQRVDALQRVEQSELASAVVMGAVVKRSIECEIARTGSPPDFVEYVHSLWDRNLFASDSFDSHATWVDSLHILLLSSAAQLAINSDRSMPATELAREALNLARHTFGEEHREVRRQKALLGEILVTSGERETGRKLIQESLSAEASTTWTTKDENQIARLNLFMSFLSSDAEKGERFAIEAREAAKQSMCPDPILISECSLRLCAVFAKTKQWSKAHDMAIEMLAVLESRFGKCHVRIARAYGTLGNLFSEEGGHLAEAEFYSERSYNAFLELCGPSSGSTCTARHNWGKLLKKSGRWAEAAEVLYDNVIIRSSLASERCNAAEAFDSLWEALKVGGWDNEADKVCAAFGS